MVLALLILASAVLVIILIGTFIDLGECPREIVGYNCRGSRCDHSEQAIIQAKEVIKR